MNRSIRLIPIFMFLGCAQPKVFKYSWGTIIEADPGTVNKACAGGNLDDGTITTKETEIYGCTIGKTIYVRWDGHGARAIVHELAHLDGHEDPRKEGYEW